MRRNRNSQQFSCNNIGTGQYYQQPAQTNDNTSKTPNREPNNYQSSMQQRSSEWHNSPQHKQLQVHGPTRNHGLHQLYGNSTGQFLNPGQFSNPWNISNSNTSMGITPAGNTSQQARIRASNSNTIMSIIPPGNTSQQARIRASNSNTSMSIIPAGNTSQQAQIRASNSNTSMSIIPAGNTSQQARIRASNSNTSMSIIPAGNTSQQAQIRASNSNTIMSIIPAGNTSQQARIRASNSNTSMSIIPAGNTSQQARIRASNSNTSMSIIPAGNTSQQARIRASNSNTSMSIIPPGNTSQQAQIRASNSNTIMSIIPAGNTSQQARIRASNSNTSMGIIPAGNTSQQARIRSSNNNTSMSITPAGNTSQQAQIRSSNSNTSMSITPAGNTSQQARIRSSNSNTSMGIISAGNISQQAGIRASNNSNSRFTCRSNIFPSRPFCVNHRYQWGNEVPAFLNNTNNSAVNKQAFDYGHWSNTACKIDYGHQPNTACNFDRSQASVRYSDASKKSCASANSLRSTVSPPFTLYTIGSQSDKLEQTVVSASWETASYQNEDNRVSAKKSIEKQYFECQKRENKQKEEKSKQKIGESKQEIDIKAPVLESEVSTDMSKLSEQVKRKRTNGSFNNSPENVKNAFLEHFSNCPQQEIKRQQYNIMTQRASETACLNKREFDNQKFVEARLGLERCTKQDINTGTSETSDVETRSLQKIHMQQGRIDNLGYKMTDEKDVSSQRDLKTLDKETDLKRSQVKRPAFMVAHLKSKVQDERLNPDKNNLNTAANKDVKADTTNVDGQFTGSAIFRTEISDITNRKNIDHGRENVFRKFGVVDTLSTEYNIIKFSQSKTESSRTPLSPSQSTNQTVHKTKVNFIEDVDVIGSEGEMGLTKIDDSKPYRLKLGMIEKKRRKKYLEHKKSLKEKLVLECKKMFTLKTCKASEIPKLTNVENSRLPKGAELPETEFKEMKKTNVNNDLNERNEVKKTPALLKDNSDNGMNITDTYDKLRTVLKHASAGCKSKLFREKNESSTLTMSEVLQFEKGHEQINNCNNQGKLNSTGNKDMIKSDKATIESRINLDEDSLLNELQSDLMKAAVYSPKHKDRKTKTRQEERTSMCAQEQATDTNKLCTKFDEEKVKTSNDLIRKIPHEDTKCEKNNDEKAKELRMVSDGHKLLYSKEEFKNRKELNPVDELCSDKMKLKFKRNPDRISITIDGHDINKGRSSEQKLSTAQFKKRNDSEEKKTIKCAKNPNVEKHTEQEQAASQLQFLSEKSRNKNKEKIEQSAEETIKDRINRFKLNDKTIKSTNQQPKALTSSVANTGTEHDADPKKNDKMPETFQKKTNQEIKKATKDIERSYCNRTILDGDRITTCVIRSPPLSINASYLAKTIEYHPDNKVSDYRKLDIESFPIAVINTRTKSAKTVDDLNEIEKHNEKQHADEDFISNVVQKQTVGSVDKTTGLYGVETAQNIGQIANKNLQVNPCQIKFESSNFADEGPYVAHSLYQQTNETVNAGDLVEQCRMQYKYGPTIAATTIEQRYFNTRDVQNCDTSLEQSIELVNQPVVCQSYLQPQTMANPVWNLPTFRGWNQMEPVPGIGLPSSDLRQTSVFMQQEIGHHKATIYHVEDKHKLLTNPICSSLTQSGFIHDYHFKNKAYSCDFDVTNSTSRSSDMNQVGVNTHIFNESKFNEGTDPKQCDSKCEPLKQELSLEQNDKDSTKLNRDKAVSQLRNSDKESEKEDSNIPIIPVITVEDDNMEQGNIFGDKTGLFVKEKLTGAEVELPSDNAFKVSMTPETPRIVDNLDQDIQSNATISNCKVDPEVLQQIKKSCVVLSPLKLTTDMEGMIDDYISSNISLFLNPSSLSECHSPSLSIETPLSTPNTSPELVSTSLYPPVLSPIIMKHSNEKVKNHQLNPHPSKQKKKRSISGMKNLSSILPARHNQNREKSLFETAERFLGEEMLSNKRKGRKVDKSGIFEPVNPIDISRDKGNLKDITGNNRDAPNLYTDKEAESVIISSTDEDEITIQRDQKKVKEINKSVNCNKVKSVNKIPPFSNPKKNAVKPTKRKFDSTIAYLQDQFETDRNKTEELLPTMDKNLEDVVKQEPPNDGQSSANKKKHFPVVHVENSTDFPNVLMEGRKPNTEEKEEDKMVLRKKYETTYHYVSDISGKGALSSKEKTSEHKFSDKVTIFMKDGIWSMNTSKSQSKKRKSFEVVDSQAVAANTVPKQSNLETENSNDVSEIIPAGNSAELDESKVVKNEKVGIECKKQKKKKGQTDLSKNETSTSEPKGKMSSMKTSASYNTYNRDVKFVDLNERKDDNPSMPDAVPCKKKNSKTGKQNFKLAEESQKKQGKANLGKEIGNNSTSKPESLKLEECQKNLTSTLLKDVKGSLKRKSETQNGTEVEACAENRSKKTSTDQAEFKDSFRKVSSEKKKQVKRKTAKDCVKTNISYKTVDVSASNVTGEKTRKRNLPLNKQTDNQLVSKFVKDSKKANVAADRKTALSNLQKKISNIKKGCGKKKICAKGVVKMNCRICNESFADLKLLNGHTAKAHQFRCTWCKIEFKDAEASKKHYFSHLKMSFSCYTCDKKFTNTTVYEQHMNSKKHAKRVQKVNNLQTGVSADQLQQCSHPVPVSASQLQQCSHPIPVCASQLQQCSHPIPVCASQLQQCSHPVPACASELQQLSHLIPVPSPVSSTCINNVIQFENVKEPSSNKGDMYLQQPSDTMAQFYTNLEQASQLSWCDLNVSDNSLEFYVQNVDNDTDCGQGYLASLNDVSTLTGSRTEPDSEVFVENGKTFTVMSNSHQDITTPTTSGSSNTICVADVTSAEVTGLDLSSSGMDDNDTAPICRIANSFSLLPYLQNNK